MPIYSPWLVLLMFGTALPFLTPQRIWAYVDTPGDKPWKSLLAIALLAVLLSTSHTAYRWGPVLLLFGIFLLVSSGASLFGLLHLRGAVRMGTISYGIYILQGPVLTVLFAPGVLGEQVMRSQPVYWLAAVGNGLALIAVAAIAHRLIEQPGIELGKRITARLQAMTRQMSATQST